MTVCKVFYSWQSDLPNSTNRSFIEKALKDAVKLIRNDELIEIEPVIDRDTVGVPGSPDIANTIFEKIEQAGVFVCDISIINSVSKSRPTPNPNILIELGYAIKALGSQRIVMVINTAFGRPEQLPFDLRMRRVVTYTMPENNTEKATERKHLGKRLQVALNSIFTDRSLQIVSETIEPISIGDQARIAVENAQPNQEALTRKFMIDLIEKLDDVAPDFTNKVSAQDVVDAINRTIKIGIEFADLAEAIALMSASKAAMVMYKGFENILKKYYAPRDYKGSNEKGAFDFYRFIGYEFFLMFVSSLIREEQWKIIAQILDKDFYVENACDLKPDTVSFTYVCSDLESLQHRKIYLNSNRASIQADLINERHTQGELAKVVPIEQFIDADLFLWLRSKLQASDNGFQWWPQSLIYMKQLPRYLTEAKRTKNAKRLLEPLGVDNLDRFRERMIDIKPELCKIAGHPIMGILYPFHPLNKFEPQTIGSLP